LPKKTFFSVELGPVADKIQMNFEHRFIVPLEDLLMVGGESRNN